MSYNSNVQGIAPFDNFHLPRWSELPALDLYMDQIITFIDGHIGSFLTSVGSTPITKSMVNNYVKAKIVDAPVNKKYPKLSVAMIIVVYILKNCFSTEEIGRLIRFGITLDPDCSITYDRFCEAMENAVKAVFSGNIHIENRCEPGRESRYLMDNFALAFASKLYVQKIFYSC